MPKEENAAAESPRLGCFASVELEGGAARPAASGFGSGSATRARLHGGFREAVGGLVR